MDLFWNSFSLYQNLIKNSELQVQESQGDIRANFLDKIGSDIIELYLYFIENQKISWSKITESSILKLLQFLHEYYSDDYMILVLLKCHKLSRIEPTEIPELIRLVSEVKSIFQPNESDPIRIKIIELLKPYSKNKFDLFNEDFIIISCRLGYLKVIKPYFDKYPTQYVEPKLIYKAINSHNLDLIKYLPHKKEINYLSHAIDQGTIEIVKYYIEETKLGSQQLQNLILGKLDAFDESGVMNPEIYEYLLTLIPITSKILRKLLIHDDLNIVKLSERFNVSDKDWRYALNEGQYPQYFLDHHSYSESKIINAILYQQEKNIKILLPRVKLTARIILNNMHIFNAVIKEVDKKVQAKVFETLVDQNYDLSGLHINVPTVLLLAVWKEKISIVELCLRSIGKSKWITAAKIVNKIQGNREIQEKLQSLQPTDILDIEAINYLKSWSRRFRILPIMKIDKETF